MKALKYENMKARNHKNIRTRSRDFMFSCSRDRGFVLPLAVLLAGILLSIGLAIFSITLKELTLSSSGRESQIAFFAADAGTECALYWDVRHPNFQTSIFDTYTASNSSSEKRTFSHTGSNQTFTVPAGVTGITVKAWGAGGGGYSSSNNGGSGGGGGYSTAQVPVTPGETLTIVVGGGGAGGNSIGREASGAGGGGSAVLRGGTAILVAGGGGGGGYQTGGNPSGGAGGGTLGISSNGGGGTQTGPGAGGIGGRRNGNPGSGTDGGDGVNVNNSCSTGSGFGYGKGGGSCPYDGDGGSGGGGGGYYGGGSGGGDAGGYSGGGGSGFVPSGGTTTAGSGFEPPNMNDPDYASETGIGGAPTYRGGNGRIVISWSGGPQEGLHEAVPQGSNAFCGGEDITLPASGWDPNTGWDSSVSETNAVTTIFDMKFQNGTCASVTVLKDNGATKIDSRGYNSCDASNMRRVERGLRVLY